MNPDALRPLDTDADPPIPDGTPGPAIVLVIVGVAVLVGAVLTALVITQHG